MQSKIVPSSKCSIIGPHLAYPRPGELNILIALPRKREVQELHCEVILGNEVKSLTSSSSDKVYNLFRFRFTDLPHGQMCSYRFFDSKGNPLDLEGLTVEDCLTRIPSKQLGKFVALSCHHPFYGKAGGTDAAWQGWVSLAMSIDRENIGLLAMLGDQVYNDDVFLKAEKIFREKQPTAKEQVTELLIDNYLEFWGDLRYRRVLAKVSSITAWDDHDIVDGYGSRPEQWEAENQAVWLEYFSAANEIFAAYQASRNPPRLEGAPEGTYSFVFESGDSKILVLDLRSEKNASKKILLSKLHQEAVISAIQKCETSSLFVAFPTTVSRMSEKVEEAAYAASGIAYELRKKRLKEPNHWLFNGILGAAVNAFIGAPEVADLRDDIDDGLMASGSKECFLSILNAMFEWQERSGGKATILGGDIHSSGATELIRGNASILQIVSSPIANEPMSNKLLAATTYVGERVLAEKAGVKILARNISYFDGRTFAVLPFGGERAFCRFISTVYSRPLDIPMSFVRADRTKAANETLVPGVNVEP